jgi:ABC-type sugar transport system ATPase subunit
LQKEGISIIYISHHLQEIFEIADTVTILRDGKNVCDADVAKVDEDFLISNMVGRQIGNMYGERKSSEKIGKTIFEVKNLSRGSDFKNVSFNIRQGEIVGFSGLVGAGRTELGRAVFGAEPADSGSILIEGEHLTLRDTKQAIQAGIGYLTEDRKDHGLYITFDIKSNLVSNHLKDFSSGRGFLKRKKVEHFAQKQVKEFNIITPGISQLINNLSGGNQQKVLVACWFGIGPKILIVDEPTRGVDVGAKNDIYKLLRRLASEGVGIMLISSDLPEIIGISDRVYVMREGEIVGELEKKDSTEEKIISLATGIHSGE